MPQNTTAVVEDVCASGLTPGMSIVETPEVERMGTSDLGWESRRKLLAEDAEGFHFPREQA